jgi:hypothetical protein
MPAWCTARRATPPAEVERLRHRAGRSIFTRSGSPGSALELAARGVALLMVLLMASGTLERHRAVGSGFGGRQMPLRDAGYRRTTLDACWAR